MVESARMNWPEGLRERQAPRSHALPFLFKSPGPILDRVYG